MRRLGRTALVLLSMFLVASGCSREPRSTGEPAARDISVIVASYDLAVGPPSRFIAGLIDKDQAPIAGGTVRMRFKAVDGGETTTVEGRFLEVPQDAGDHSHPEGDTEHQHLPEGFGVYAAEVAFDRPGNWKVVVESDSGSGEAAFEVESKHKVPYVGDPALPTENLTINSEAEPEAIDSRAQGAPIPDPKLHETTIKAALEAKRPMVVVFSTPVWCVSRFCGPVTDMVHSLASSYSDRAEFIHIEIWKDREGQVVNKAAAEWLLRDGDLQEPWVFFIGGDGIIKARWDNVATRAEVEPHLQQLPAS